MSKEKCLERAGQVHEEGAGCSLLSYSPSAGPQGKTDFCRCFSSCGGDLIHPAGEQWETVEIAASSSRADGGREGLCQGDGYMNIAWGGMSRGQCMDRAYQVEQDTGRCGHVSYSRSLTSNFCRCFPTCDGELQKPEGEEWETRVPRPADKHGLRNLVLVCIVAGAAACLVLVGCAGACLWIRCRRRSSEAQSLADGGSPADNSSTSGTSGNPAVVQGVVA